MPRYIDADKIISHLNDEIELCGCPDLDRNTIAHGTYLGLLSAKSFIETAETADVQEVRHGRWINESRNMYGPISAQCSVCVLFSGTWLRNAPYKYCPHCGAKMDGGKNQDDNHT